MGILGVRNGGKFWLVRRFSVEIKFFFFLNQIFMALKYLELLHKS